MDSRLEAAFHLAQAGTRVLQWNLAHEAVEWLELLDGVALDSGDQALMDDFVEIDEVPAAQQLVDLVAAGSRPPAAARLLPRVLLDGLVAMTAREMGPAWGPPFVGPGQVPGLSVRRRASGLVNAVFDVELDDFQELPRFRVSLIRRLLEPPDGQGMVCFESRGVRARDVPPVRPKVAVGFRRAPLKAKATKSELGCGVSLFGGAIQFNAEATPVEAHERGFPLPGGNLRRQGLKTRQLESPGHVPD